MGHIAPLPPKDTGHAWFTEKRNHDLLIHNGNDLLDDSEFTGHTTGADAALKAIGWERTGEWRETWNQVDRCPQWSAPVRLAES